MNTLQLERSLRCLLKQTGKQNEVGLIVDAWDKITPSRFTDYKHYCVVLNTSKSGTPGIHWVSAYVTRYRNKLYANFFDSYGRLPSSYRIRLPFKIVKWNNYVLQTRYSDVCGQYCIYFLMHRLQGYSLEEVQSHFSSRLWDNDSHVKRFTDHLYFQCRRLTRAISTCQICRSKDQAEEERKHASKSR